MDAFTQLAGEAVGKFGYLGLFIALILNCMGVPIASEVMLPLTGWAVRMGNLDPYGAYVVTVTAQVIGFLFAYALAMKDGLPLLERYGKFVFVRHKQIREMQQRMKKSGQGVEIIGLLVPGIHGYMGYLGGLGKMRLRRFLPLIILGTMIWTAALMALGYFAGSQLQAIGNYSRYVSVTVTIAVLAAAVIWYSRRYWRKRHR